MKRRLGPVGLVVALAAIGFAVYRNHHPLMVNTGGDLPLPVLHAKGPIQKGTTGLAIEKGLLFTVKNVRRSEIPKGAVLSPRSLVGKVAVTNIPAGAELNSSDFGPLHAHP
jgi:flagella basal body P-ring formation protein FlgA